MSQPLTGTATAAPDTTVIARSRAIVESLFDAGHPWPFAVRFWTGEVLPAETPATRFTLALSGPGALRRMFWPPDDLAAGEAYIGGDFDIEGDIIAAVALEDLVLLPRRSPGEWGRLARDLFSLPKAAEGQFTGRGRARVGGRQHSRQRDSAAAHYH